jgi:RHS repeat-associated protein
MNSLNPETMTTKDNLILDIKRTKRCAFICLLFSLFSMSLVAQITPIPDEPEDGPIGPIDDQMLLPGSLLSKEVSASPVSTASVDNTMTFFVEGSVRATIRISGFQYVQGYGNAINYSTSTLSLSLSTENGMQPEVSYSMPFLSSLTNGGSVSYCSPDTILLTDGMYSLTFNGIGSGSAVHPNLHSGISLQSTVLAPPKYFVTITLEGFLAPPGTNPYLEAEPISIGSSGRNYRVQRTFLKSDASEWRDEIVYYDGLGRAAESIQPGITPSLKDLAFLQEYDSLGREVKRWLPATIGANNQGEYLSPEILKNSMTTLYQGETRPYAETLYEASPLNRITEQYGAGASWYANGKSGKTAYYTNTQSAPYQCKRYTVSSTGSLVDNGLYANAQLYVTRTEDEDGNTVYSFTDKEGKAILTRQMNGTVAYDTYTVYDVYGNKRFVLPPKYQEEPDVSKYAYQYEYDARHRLIRKTLPGSDYIRYVYDRADQLIFAQDGNQRSKSTPEWTFTIPDIFGRTVLTGTCTNTFTAGSDPLGDAVVVAAYSATGATGTVQGYTLQNITLSNAKVHTANYYDNYSFLSLLGSSVPSLSYVTHGVDEIYQTRYSGTFGSTYPQKGLLTGSITLQLDDATTPSYLYTAYYYDYLGREIQVQSTNHTGGMEKEFIAYSFAGKVIRQKHIHTKGSSTQTEEYAYTYDHADRLLTTTHKLNSGNVVTLANNEYDELGRLKSNSRNGVAALKSNYTYNVRSWMKSQTGSLFNQELFYNDTYAGSTPQYNGNISAMTWRGNETLLRGYTFAYDNLSRLTAANYKENGTASTKYGTSYTYDKQSNITALQRRGKTGSGATSFDMVDNLTMTYNGNQLVGVLDTEVAPDLSQNISNDFRTNTLPGTRYTYDANGNRTKDLNQKINSVTYNLLNLPRQMSIDGQMNTYTYAADGRKLRTVQGTSMNTDYCGNFIYENNVLKRILIDGGYIDASTGVYYFYLADHLGNNRVVANASGVASQVYHYYPYGMLFADQMNSNGQPYKYAGKEFDMNKNLFWSDFGARHYYGTVPGFTTMDPRAESYYGMSPYGYVAGNPINNIDPNGESFWGFLGIAIGSLLVTDFAVGALSNLDGNWLAAGWDRVWNQVEFFGGLFVGNAWQILSRWTWELPQTVLGFGYSSGRNLFEKIDHVKYYDGATFVINEYKDGASSTLGSYINIKGNRPMPVDEYGNFAPYKEKHYMHEYGHYLQSQDYGWGYLFSVALRSADTVGNPEEHRTKWYEMNPNKRAERYFRSKYKKYGIIWKPDDPYYPYNID